jgi:hypothetical protein
MEAPAVEKQGSCQLHCCGSGTQGFVSGSGNGLLTHTRKLHILRSAHSGFTVFIYVQNLLVKECPVNTEEVQMHPVML